MKKYCNRVFVVAVSVVAALSVACGAIKDNAGQVMVELGLMSAPEITQVTLAVPVPFEYAEENTGFLNGIELAREDISGMDMPVELLIQTDDDKGDFGSAVELAGGYINDDSVIGVVGHWYSDICVPVSSIYGLGKKTLIVPTVSISSLTSPPSDYVFRNIPADDQISTKMCDYAKRHGAKKAVVYYEDSAYGFEMSAGLESYADSIGIEVVDRVCSPALNRELPLMEKKWRAIDYDTVFVISNVKEGAEFVNALRLSGFEGQIICGDGMDSASLIDYLTPGSGSLVVSSIFNSEQPPESIARFQERYNERFGTQPDVWAVQGYDCIMIVAGAVADHNVRTSGQLSEFLQAADSLNSVFGDTSFDERHEINGKPVYLKKYNGKQFEYIN